MTKPVAYADLDDLGRDLVDRTVVEAIGTGIAPAERTAYVACIFGASMVKLLRERPYTVAEIKALDRRLGDYAKVAIARLAEVAAAGGGTAGRA